MPGLPSWATACVICALLAGCASAREASFVPENVAGECPPSALRIGAQRERVLEHTVMVRTEPANAGAGILVAAAGIGEVLVATAAHVVRDADRIEIKRYGVESWEPASLRWHHPIEDIALLDTRLSRDDLGIRFPFVCLLARIEESALESERLQHVGFAEGPWTVSRADGDFRSSDERSIMFTSEDFFPGQSGGPLVNEVWHMIGVNVGRSIGATNRALRMDRVEDLLIAALGTTLEWTVGRSTDEMAVGDSRARLGERVLTMLNEYYYRAKDLLMVMQQGRVTTRERDPTYFRRVQDYNIAHDELVNQRTAVMEKLRLAWDARRATGFDSVYASVRGESDDPESWRIGDRGLHPAIYQGLRQAIFAHNDGVRSGVVDRELYEPYLRRAIVSLASLRREIDRFIKSLELAEG